MSFISSDKNKFFISSDKNKFIMFMIDNTKTK